MLKQGQVVRYDDALWQVEYVNKSRARIIPLQKRHVVLKGEEGEEKRVFDAAQRGVNISPDSQLDVVEDTSTLQDELELLQIEKEIKRLKAQVEREAAPATEKVKKAVVTPAPTGTPEGLVPATMREYGAVWYLVGQAATIPGSLKAQTIAFVSENPGQTTKQVAAALSTSTPGAVAACLDRFRKAGVMVSAKPNGDAVVADAVTGDVVVEKKKPVRLVKKAEPAQEETSDF